MLNSKNWFTEVAPEEHCAFSLELKKKLHEEQTSFQKIEIYDTHTFGKLMVIDGCTMLSSRDNFIYHEMMSHPALFTHPDPKKILIIGGGDCGTLREVLKHASVEECIQIDIDERVTHLSEQYFPELCESNSDPRASLQFEDGIKWVREAKPESIDIIIVDSTDPVGPAAILFTEAFFRHCHRILTSDGLIIQQSESPLLHMPIIKKMRQSMQRAGFEGMSTLFFPLCIYPSGWWSATMSGKTGLSPFREKEAQNKRFNTDYYNDDIHRSALAIPEFFRRELAEM